MPRPSAPVNQTTQTHWSLNSLELIHVEQELRIIADLL